MPKFYNIIYYDDSPAWHFIPDNFKEIKARFFQSIDKYKIIAALKQGNDFSRVSKIVLDEMIALGVFKIFLRFFVGNL